MSEKSNSIFERLKIIELSSALAGPQAGTFFAELGAEVLKIEPPNGDISRKWRSKKEPSDTTNSIYYCSVNGNKETIVLDLKLPQSIKKLHTLLADCDIIITNLTQDKSRQFSLDFEIIHHINPKVILANVTGYGKSSNRPAFDVLLQAESGYLSMTGTETGSIAKIPIPIIDILAGHQLKEGILCALLTRTETGKGSEVQVSLFDSAISALANQASNYLMAQQVPGPMGTKHPSIAPYGDLFQTKDKKWIIMAIGSDKQFLMLCAALKESDLAHDPRFLTNENRVSHRIDLNNRLSDIFLVHEQQYWLSLFKERNILGGPVRNLREVFDLPAARQQIIEEKMPDGVSSKRVQNVAFRINKD